MTSTALETVPATLRDPMLPRAAVIEAIKQETHDVGTFTLRLDEEPEPYAFRPGQFNMLYLPGFGEAAGGGLAVGDGHGAVILPFT